MTTIRTRVRVDASRRLTLQLPDDVAPGEHDVTVIVDASSESTVTAPRPPLNFPVDDLGPWPKGLSLRREDMYGDDGR